MRVHGDEAVWGPGHLSMLSTNAACSGDSSITLAAAGGCWGFREGVCFWGRGGRSDCEGLQEATTGSSKGVCVLSAPVSLF
jgi:hypothetical protein